MPANPPGLILEKTAPLGVITLNRPETGNAIDARMAQELADACAGINRDPAIRAVIITAAGDGAFCAGTGKQALASLLAGELEPEMLSVAAPLAGLNVPVIAAVNGDALGQGLELALACDLRLAAATARFALTQLAAGTTPWDGATQRLPRLVGKARALEMLLTGQTLDAAGALRIGLVNRVFPAAELLPRTQEMARLIAAAAPLAIRYAREAVRQGMEMTLGQGLSLETDLYSLLQTTADRTEGIQSFRRKRPPRFKGR